MNLPVWLLVALGGALGSVARWFSEALLNQLTFNWIYSDFGFNYSILIINVFGSFAIGLVAGFGRHQVKVWSFWATGVLGGFTTFSTLMLISYWHLIDRYLGLFVLNIFATFFLAFVAVTIGIKISRTRSEA